MNLKIAVSTSIAGIGTFASYWLGGWDAGLRALVVFMVLDWVTGLLAAIWAHRVDSEVMFKGGIRKGIILIVVAIGVLLDHLLGYPAPIFRTLVVYYYASREGLSVLENIGLLGVPLPRFLAEALVQLQSPESKSKRGEK